MIRFTDRSGDVEDDENAKAWVDRQPGGSFVSRVYMAGPLEEERRAIVASHGMQRAILLELLSKGRHSWSALEEGVLGIHSEAGRRVRVHMVEAGEAFLLLDMSRFVVVVPSRSDVAAMDAARAWVEEMSKIHAKAGLPMRFYLSTGPKEAALEVASEREDLGVPEWTRLHSHSGER